MKKLLGFALLGGLLVACGHNGSSAGQSTTPPTPATTANDDQATPPKGSNPQPIAPPN